VTCLFTARIESSPAEGKFQVTDMSGKATVRVTGEDGSFARTSPLYWTGPGHGSLSKSHPRVFGGRMRIVVLLVAMRLPKVS
jgi:hypothetical protein